MTGVERLLRMTKWENFTMIRLTMGIVIISFAFAGALFAAPSGGTRLLEGGR